NSMAEHIRETIKFAKNSCNSMNRFALFQFYHNFRKEYRINKKVSQPHITHAEVAGICRERVNRIIDSVFHGLREPLEFVEEYLSPFQRRLWKMVIPNPLKVAVVPK
nr:hypothetical protein [Spirochaetaceae bacterium]